MCTKFGWRQDPQDPLMSAHLEGTSCRAHSAIDAAQNNDLTDFARHWLYVILLTLISAVFLGVFSLKSL